MALVVSVAALAALKVAVTVMVEAGKATVEASGEAVVSVMTAAAKATAITSSSATSPTPSSLVAAQTKCATTGAAVHDKGYCELTVTVTRLVLIAPWGICLPLPPSSPAALGKR